MTYLRSQSSARGSIGALYNDDRAQRPDYSSVVLRDGSDQLWPRSGLLSGNGYFGSGLTNGEDIWDWSLWLSAAPGMGQRRNQLVGITRDSTGAALGGVTVKAFDSLTDQLVDSVVSDANGNFAVCASFGPSTQLYCWAFKAGTPVEGATAILTPS